jgi:hypothetical protein
MMTLATPPLPEFSTLGALLADDVVPEETTSATAGFTMLRLLQFTVGFVGIQFAWNTQLVLAQQVLEPLGANPFWFSVIWCVGPLLALVLQPVLAICCEQRWLPLGQRKLFITLGSMVAGIALLCFPTSVSLFAAAGVMCLMELGLSMAQFPYRSLIGVVISTPQIPIVNSFTSIAFAFAPVLALGLVPCLQPFHLSMSLLQQYQLSAVVLVLLTFCGLLAVKEKPLVTLSSASQSVSSTPVLKQVLSRLLVGFSAFRRANTNVHKLCQAQFVIWVGIMCLFIYLTPYVVHSVYELPDASTPAYKQEESLFELAKTVDDNTLTATDYKKIATVVDAVSLQKQKWLVPTVADVAALNQQLDTTLATYLPTQVNQALATVTAIAKSKAFASGVSEADRTIELKLALLEYPLYAKALDTQAEQTTLAEDQTLGNFNTLPILEMLDKQQFFADSNQEARNTTMLGLVVFNIMALLLTIPAALVAKRWGKKLVLTFSLVIMAGSLAVAPFIHNAEGVYYLLALLAGAGVGWAALLSLPFALLNDWVTAGEEAPLMNMFQLFVCIPQFIAALGLGQWITYSPVMTQYGGTHQWSLALLVASVMVAVGVLLLQRVAEKPAS